MDLKIVISSAVELEEKKYVKEKLRELEKMHLIKIGDLYDCADHATSWGIKSKQEVINEKILCADWFICLIPDTTVGKATWKELELVLRAKKTGALIAISIFHPMNHPQQGNCTSTPPNRLQFKEIKQQAEDILGNKEEQYWISYQYNNKEDLLKKLTEEYIKLYYTDRVFRTQHLNGLAKTGCDIKAEELYFDKERANIANGFYKDKYFPRRSVDGKLQEAMMEQRKFTILLGSPGSGKTRAVYQMLSNPQQLVLADHEEYALGILADQNVIIIHRDNIRQVYQFIKDEEDYNDSEYVLSEYYLVCDQIKDVFGMLTNEELFCFFDIVSNYKHIHMIATSIPSAFSNFLNRWEHYGRKPMADDQLTKVINIPQISSDDEEGALRNWIRNELQGSTFAETIGDYIPKLNNYKQGIVRKIYEKNKMLSYLPEFLSALQITETYRHDTALFLPILIARKNIYPKEELSNWNDFHKEIIRTINFLIASNVIWVRLSSAGGGKEAIAINELHEKMFSQDYDIDDADDFTFDEELFPNTPISTSYSYGVNEIVWDELEKEDANRHMSHRETLLKDYQNVKEVIRSAKEFYRAFPTIRTLRRILPRIPQTDCYNEAVNSLWDFIYNKCIKIEPTTDEQEEFITAIGMLIGRARDMVHVKDAISIILQKDIKPNYNIIGELYSVSIRLGNETKLEISQYVIDIRNRYQLIDNSFFSMAREIVFHNMTFDMALEAIRNSKYKIHCKSGDLLLSIWDTTSAIEYKTDMRSLEMMFAIVAKKGETIEQWSDLFKLHQEVHVNIRRSTIRQFFAVVANHYSNQLREWNYYEPNDLMMTHLLTLLNQFDDIISLEDKESCYFYSVESSWNFRQASTIYLHYINTFKLDNQRLVSMALSTVRDHEFQRALSFLIEVDSRLKKKGLELNHICYNNLIKYAPNMGEALGVVPYLSHLQDHTLANILTVLKNKRHIKSKNSKTGLEQDSKMFYYAYSAVMRDIFFELRKSPHVIGALYDLATTPKHERFIRDVFLSHIEERVKFETIDYSTRIASIRLQKNYRKLDEVWEIFNTCRNHFRDKNMYVNSDLYNCMMRKLMFLCTTEDSLKLQQDKLRSIINEDFNRIIRDEYFYSLLYRFFPEKEVFDSDGNISKNFKKDIEKSEITHIKPLNNIMANIRSKGFEFVWKFYEFILSYYQQQGKWKALRPEIRTVTYLLNTVKTKEQFEKTDKIAKQWFSERLLNANKLYHDCYDTKRRELGYNTDEKDGEKEKNTVVETQRSPKENPSDYKQRANNVIDMAIRDIYLYGILTATLFNRYLKNISYIMDDIGRDQHFSDNNIKKRCKEGTYRNLIRNLIEKYPDNINYDALSYVYLVNLSPSKWDVMQWMNKLKEKENNYKYDMIICATIAQNVEVCLADIDTALDYFEFWENIVYDIGYDPADPTSFSKTTHITRFNGIKDYDGYWLTRSTHCMREMFHYWQCLKQNKGYVDKTALKFIKQQMDFFDRYNIPFPQFTIRGKTINFRQEILKLE